MSRTDFEILGGLPEAADATVQKNLRVSSVSSGVRALGKELLEAKVPEGGGRSLYVPIRAHVPQRLGQAGFKCCD